MNPTKFKAAISTAKEVYREIFEGLPLWRGLLSALVLLIFSIALLLLWLMFWLLEKIGGDKP